MTRYLDVSQLKCKSCAHCEDYCPTGAIQSIKTTTKYAKHQIPDLAICMNCAQCLKNCVYGAIYECVTDTTDVAAAIAASGTLTIAMPAPAIRYTLAEEFGITSGSYVGGKLNTALRMLGFDKVWDVEFAADVTIMEESAELIGRINGTLDRPLPMFTSCCPAWVKYVETFYPALIPHVSTTRSPTQILGALAKTYGATTIGASAANIYTTAIMPCVAKKFEGDREENNKSGYRDVDATLTTRELITMINNAGIEFASLTDSEPDEPFKLSTGAATIFCASGGVMEAALRRAVEVLNGTTLTEVEFTAVRGTEGLKTASVVAGGKTVRVAVVNGLKNAKDVCDQVVAGTAPYDFIEVMSCPDGCINGGGQPYTV